MTTARVLLPPKLVPVFEGDAMFRGAYGGRGSTKTMSFAKMAAVFGLRKASEGREGIILCARQYMNSLDESSLMEVKAAITSEPWLAECYEVGQKFVRTRDLRVEFKFAGLHVNLNTIKSKAKILLLWVDEAEQVGEPAWMTAIPTVREDGAEIWVTWNPGRKKSATHKRFRDNPPADAKIVQMNWRDNPWFPAILDRTRRDDLANRPETYDHVWEGGFVKAQSGAYYAELLAQARLQKRIGIVTADPLLPLRAFHDIGGAGRNADAYTIWIVQWVAQEIRVLDYYEAQGQVIAHHVNWMREKKYDKAINYLPHDGVATSNITGKRYEDHWRDAGFNVEPPVKNQGPGAAVMRIEALRRLGPKLWFHEPTTEPGLDAIGWYHEKRSSDDRDIGLGPEHDWSSHAADALGLMAVCYIEPGRQADFGRKIAYPSMGYA